MLGAVNGSFADDTAVGVTNASVSHVAEIATNAPINRFITEMLPSVREY